MYVDESGDTGLVNSPTQYFALSGLVVHESDWRAFITALLEFRRTVKQVYGLPIREEIHAAPFIQQRVRDLKRHERLAILRNALDELAKMQFISITSVIVDKHGKQQNYDVFNQSWMALFQRFENTLKWGNFPRKKFPKRKTEGSEKRKRKFPKKKFPKRKTEVFEKKKLTPILTIFRQPCGGH